MADKPEILLVQLPHPSYASRNLPLAGGCLKAAAFAHGLLESANVTILEQAVGDFGGCQMIIDEIVSRAPDVLGFSIYLWNAERTLYVIGQVKARLPSLTVMAGGPEVTRESSYILAAADIDVFAFGEGELTFVELLSHFVRGQPALHQIEGIAYRSNGALATTRPRARLADIGGIPSPYLLGYIDPRNYCEMMLFTMRGCLLSCSYCGWNGRGRLRTYPLERLRQELELAARAQCGMTISLLDSAFNCSPVFADFCQVAQEVNRDGRLKFNCFLQADLVTEETAKLLKESNFIGVEVGLQSADATVLANVNRSIDKDGFLRGVRILKAAQLPVRVDIILGLPGDSPASFERTMSFANENHLETSIFNLALAHGAALTRRPESFAAQVQTAPPFYVLGTKTFPSAELKSAFARYHTASADFDPILNLQHPHLRHPLPIHETLLDVRRIRDVAHPIRNIIVDAAKPIACDAAYASAMAEEIAHHVGSDLSLNLIGERDDLQRSLWFLRRLFSEISRANPFINWTLHLEAARDFPTETLIEELCLFRPGKVFLDYRNELLPDELDVVRRKSVAVFAHVPYDVDLPLPSCRCIRTAVLQKGPAGPQVEQLVQTKGSGLLIELPESLGIACAREVMAQLHSSGRSVFFADWVLQRIWELEYLRCTPAAVDHTELLIHWDGGVYARHFDEDDLGWSALTRWKLFDSAHGNDDPLAIIETLAASSLAGKGQHAFAEH